MTNRVLFICTGNYYRSRYAEIYFNTIAQNLSIDWEADSCGLDTSGGHNVGPISKFALERLKIRNISPDPLRYPRQLEEKDLQEASLIIAINRVEHQPMIERQFPAWADRITYWEIADLNITSADNALSALESNVEKLVANLATSHNQ